MFAFVVDVGCVWVVGVCGWLERVGGWCVWVVGACGWLVCVCERVGSSFRDMIILDDSGFCHQRYDYDMCNENVLCHIIIDDLSFDSAMYQFLLFHFLTSS